MRPELQHIEHIERYLEERLSPKEKQVFEQQMASDAQLRAEVSLQKDLVRQVRETAFLAELEQAHASFAAQAPADNRRPRWLWSSLLLLLLGTSGAGLWWATRPTPPAVVQQTETEAELPSATPALATAAPEQWLPNVQVPYQKKRLSAQRAQRVALQGLQATLAIPADALVDADGNPVQGSYELAYRSLEHPSDRAAAGLPLIYQGQTAQGIASAALLDLRATQDGRPLYLADGKVLELDLTLPERQEDLGWYHLNEQRQWQLQEQAVAFPEEGAYTETLDKAAYQKALEDYEKAVEERERGVVRKGATYDAGKTALLPKDIEKLPEIERPDRRSYLVRHYDNPRLVRGLQLASFGVYNCGRAYQVSHQVAVAARYTDAQRKIIEQGHVLSVVDLDADAAYSFEPSQFICNGKANNVFLLWTTEGELYSFVKLATVDLKTGVYSFRMEHLTDRVQVPEDLRDYLDFVEEKIKDNS